MGVGVTGCGGVCGGAGVGVCGGEKVWVWVWVWVWMQIRV